MSRVATVMKSVPVISGVAEVMACSLARGSASRRWVVARSVFSTFAIASAATIGLAPSAAAERSALERYRPVLRYDRSERDYPRTVEAVVRGDRVVTADGPVVYGREQPRPEGGAFLQYWIFYAYNGQDRGILRTGRH